jgi:DNA-binding LacI/PurR family transcriptional regulator
MPHRRVTSRQVAELAGVSQTTVSFVLNGVESANISTETRQRVVEVAHQLGYVPDAAARSLARGRSSNIGLILIKPHKQIFIDFYVSNVIAGLNQVIQKDDLRLLVQVVDGDSRPDFYTDLAKGKEVAGLIVILYSPTKDDFQALQALTSDGFPLVVLGYPVAGFYSVIADHFSGVRKAVTHLIDLGQQRIACITYAPIDINPHAGKRLRIYQQTLEGAGLSYDPSLVRYGEFDAESGYHATVSLLDEGKPPTAVFAMNDVMAIGAMKAIQDRGLRIPEDIAIIGFDDIQLAQFTNPPLTTIHAPDIEQGQCTAEMLMDLIKGNTISEPHQWLSTELIVRGSCGGARS